MGVDIPDIFYIIHWGPPKSISDYWQQIGRCARNLEQGVAILYKPAFSVCKSKLSVEMYNLVNQHKCIRKAVLDEFNYKSTTEEFFTLPSNQETCCSYCASLSITN